MPSMICFDCASSNDSASKRASSARLRQYFACPSINLLPRLRVAPISYQNGATAQSRSPAAGERLPVCLRAAAIAATVTELSGFHSGREFAAWLGLVPRQNSSWTTYNWLRDKPVAADEASSRRRSTAFARLARRVPWIYFFQNGFAISPSTSAEKPKSLRWSCEHEASSSRER